MVTILTYIGVAYASIAGVFMLLFALNVLFECRPKYWLEQLAIGAVVSLIWPFALYVIITEAFSTDDD